MTGTDAGSPRPERAVAVNQVGYLPRADKIAVATADAATFRVVSTADGAVRYEDELSDPIDDPDAGERVRWAEFSSVTETGEYVVVVGGSNADGRSAGADSGEARRSAPFRIAADVYDEVLADVTRLYGLKRSNAAIGDPKTGLSIEAGHTQDAAARLYFADEFHDEGELVDVSGGWYDAGDYGKYVPPAAITVGQMLLAYELYPDAFEPGQCDLPAPPSTDDRPSDLPDLLVEAKFELEWLLRMQRPDGAVYHKVAGEEWPSLDVSPAEDVRDRYVFGLSTFGTAMFAGAMAMAARVYADRDPGFAERALESARAAHSYLEANPDPFFRFDEGQDAGSGPYRSESDAGERFWAAAELFKTTGDAAYERYLDGELDGCFDAAVRPPTWGDGLSLGQWAYLTAPECDPYRRRSLETAFLDSADGLVAAIEADGYRDALETGDYHWASTKLAVTKGELLLLADEIEPDEAYVRGALDQLHYALGRTPTGYSYVTGHGERPPENPHDRLVESTDTYLPGMLVSGANRNRDDWRLGQYIATEWPPPAKSYVDATASYAANEWAIDYTAPLFVVLGYAVTSGSR